MVKPRNKGNTTFAKRKASRDRKLIELRKLSTVEKMDMSLAPWTDRERAFVLQYRRTLNGAKAFRLAGLGEEPSYCAVGAYEILHRPHVMAYLEAWREETQKRYDTAAEKVMAEVARRAFASLGDFLTIDDNGEVRTDFIDATDDTLRGLQEITIDTYMDGSGEDARPVKSVKIKLGNKDGALELLGKHHRLFSDKVDVSGTIDVSVKIGEARARRIKARRDGVAKAEDTTIELTAKDVTPHAQAKAPDQEPEPSAGKPAPKARDIRPKTKAHDDARKARAAALKGR